MQNNYIKIRGAKVHNLKNINLDIPRDKLVVITGLSGSGKSSLAFDTIYAEGQRRYVESLSAYARQFLGLMDKPDVEKIEGLSPAISIDQRFVSHNPRSTVGTATEIYDYLRLLFSKAGTPYCHLCGGKVSRQNTNQIVDEIFRISQPLKVVILAPVARDRQGELYGLLEKIEKIGYPRIRIDGIIYPVKEVFELPLEKNKKHNIEVVIDQLIIDAKNERPRVADSIETALKIGEGFLVILASNKLRKIQKELNFSAFFVCPDCKINLPEVNPRLFSFNSPHGVCSSCTGLGVKQEIDPDLVIPNKDLSLSEGAIRPLAAMSQRMGRRSWYGGAIADLADKHSISLNIPVSKLSQDKLNFILYGDRDTEGVVSQLEKRYRETDSDFIRAEIEKYMIIKKCPACGGRRLRPEALAVRFAGVTIDKIAGMPVAKAILFFTSLAEVSSKNVNVIVKPIVKEILSRLQFLINVGLNYPTLDRAMSALSGGEAQRIRLATQIGSGLSGIIYILDEPSIGLHQRDQGRLIETLKELRDLGNTVIVVEHDEQTIRAADWIIDIGPGAGDAGGKVVFEGTSSGLLKAKTLTGEYLAGKRRVIINCRNPKSEIRNSKQIQNPKSKILNYLIIIQAAEHNLKNIDVKIPLGKFVCVSGVSGSGKSSLVNDILANALLKKFYKAKVEVGGHKDIKGLENIDKVVVVDQSPIGRTPRSNPATYAGIFTGIRDLFTKTKEARLRGYQSGSFSFNVKGGRCEECEGQGLKKIEMYFLPDVYIECEACHGSRFNKEVLEIEYCGKNVAEILEMSVAEAREFFKNIPAVKTKLDILSEVGLDYIKLGQPAPTLSGGEAQRVKLAAELSKKETSRTLYILDEPTTGLHFDDIKKLLGVLRRLVEKKNTVLVIEHNLDVLANADWIIDLGPEGGDAGGNIVAEGAPEDICKNKSSYTGKYLKNKI